MLGFFGFANHLKVPARFRGNVVYELRKGGSLSRRAVVEKQHREIARPEEKGARAHAYHLRQVLLVQFLLRKLG